MSKMQNKTKTVFGNVYGTMKAINVITAPDKIRQRSYKILLIYPDNNIQQQLQEQIHDWDHAIDIYMYTGESIDWLLDVFNMCDLCIMNLDECDKEIRNLGSYLVSFPKTYWLTKAENIVYNKPCLNIT